MRVQCTNCGAGHGALSQVDRYLHDGVTVRIYSCANCGGEGTSLDHPSRHEPEVNGDLEVAR